MIEANALSKIYPESQAGISNVNTKVRPGEWMTLLGASGSGKTTFLKLLAGLEQKTSGELVQPYSKTDVSFVFQEAALLPWKTVEENIFLPLKLRGQKSAEGGAKVDLWLEKLKLARFRTSYPHELSGGMKMRVSLARALVTDPKLLLLDEPFAALDEPIRIELGIELRELWITLKPTVFLVTHSITEGLWLADRVLLFQGQPGNIALDLKMNLGEKRPLEIRRNIDFLENVERCFKLIQGGQK